MCRPHHQRAGLWIALSGMGTASGNCEPASRWTRGSILKSTSPFQLDAAFRSRGDKTDRHSAIRLCHANRRQQIGVVRDYDRANARTPVGVAQQVGGEVHVRALLLGFQYPCFDRHPVGIGFDRWTTICAQPATRRRIGVDDILAHHRTHEGAEVDFDARQRGERAQVGELARRLVGIVGPRVHVRREIVDFANGVPRQELVTEVFEIKSLVGVLRSNP